MEISNGRCALTNIGGILQKAIPPMRLAEVKTDGA
jgi:hypothetical protein